MSVNTESPFQANPPSGRKLLLSVIAAMALAGLLLLIVVLPAEYGIDPTGAGRVLGLTQMNEPAAGIQLSDNLAGNENIATVQIPEVGEPLPLPNPAVHQLQESAPKSETITVTLPVNGETEIKTVLQANKVVLYSWKTDGGLVYVDYHGHSPEWTNKEAFVRYQEAQEGSIGASGSLVAPFAGEHGWYWLNLSDQPVVITLTVTGYYDEIKNYGSL